MTISACAVSSAYHTQITQPMPQYDTKPVHRLSCLSSSRPDGHVAIMDTSLDITRALKVSIRGLPKNWRRPPGHPRHTWLCTLEADLQPLNLGLNSAWNTLGIENTGSTSWKPLRSSLGLARDNDGKARYANVTVSTLKH